MAESLQQVPQPLRRRLYLPAYKTGEAARLVETAPVTLSYWFYREPVFAPTKKRRVPLSYLQLVEAAFVASYRKWGVSLQRIRKARQYLSKMFETEYPFALLKLKTDGVHILKDLEERENGREPKVIVTDQFGQEAWPDLIAERFEQFEYEYDVALRWFPRGRSKRIAIDPRIAFGAPIVISTGVATWVLKERYQTGETLEELEDDFGIGRDDLRLALEFEGIPTGGP